MKAYRMKAISLLTAWILAMSGCLIPVLADGSEEEENREQYFIIYDANGGEGSIEKTAVKAGEEVTLADGSGFTYEGRELTGWNTDPGGKGTEYAPGAVYSVKSDGEDSDGGQDTEGKEIRLYAMWKETARSEDNAKTGEKDGKESEPVDAQAPVIEWFCGGGAFFVGDKALLEIHASVGDGGTVSYQWYQSTDGSTAEGTAVAGAQDTLFEAPTQEAGLLYYYCVVTNTNEQADGKKTAQTVSQAVSVMVTEPRKITVDAEKPVIEWISGGGTFNQADEAMLEVKATVTDGGTLSYQWYRSEDGTTEKGTALDGATENTYYPSTDVVGTAYYYCAVTNTNEQADGEKTARVFSDPVQVTVEEWGVDPSSDPGEETVDAEKPVIEWISGGGTFDQTDQATLEVKAAVNDGGTLSYQWYRSEDGTTEKGIALDGATENTYHPSTDAAGTVYYYCVVTNTNEQASGAKTAQAVSDMVEVTVQQPASVAEKAQKPQVEGPVGGTFYESDAFVLKVKASVSDGGMLTYQWYRNKEKIEGATQAEYMPPVGTAYYYCVVININQQATLEKTAYTVSNAVEVTVKEGDRPRSAAKPEVSGPSGGGTYYKGQSPRLEVEAQTSDGGTLTYQWYRSSDGSGKGTPIEGATGAAYLPSTKDTGTVYYYCVVSNTNDEASETKTVSAASQMVKVTVIEKGAIKDEVKRAKPVSRNKNTGSIKTVSDTGKESVRKAANARTEDENQVILLLFLTLGAGTAAAALMIGRKHYR